MRSLVVFAVILAGCRIGTSSPEEFDREYPVGRLTTLSPAGMEESLAALREAVGGKVRVTHITFSEHRITIIAQNPRAPAQYDSYSFWQGTVYPSPIKTNPDSEARMAADLFDLDSAPLDRLGELALDAMTRLQMDRPHVANIVVDRTREGGLEIDVTLNSDRRNGRVTYDGKGTLLSAKLD